MRYYKVYAYEKNDKNHFLSVKQKIKVISKNYLYINQPYVSQYFTEQNTKRKLIIKEKTLFATIFHQKSLVCPVITSGGGKMTNMFQCKIV